MKQKKIKKQLAQQGIRVGVADSANVPKIDYPVFCFKHLMPGYSVNDCSAEQKAHLLDKLAYMTQKTWQDLNFSAYKNGAGFEQLDKGSMNVPLPSIVTDDVSKLHVIRFNSMNHRLIGMRSGHTYHITHIDIGLTAYNH